MYADMKILSLMTGLQNLKAIMLSQDVSSSVMKWDRVFLAKTTTPPHFLP